MGSELGDHLRRELAGMNEPRESVVDDGRPTSGVPNRAASPIDSGARHDWLLWQLADSAFPTGGFAHSGGLEAAWQHGEIRGAEDLASFLEAYMCQVAAGMI